MKSIILILVTLLAASFSQKTKDYVLTGQLYYTPSPGYIEKIYGKVKKVIITNYLAKEENGKFTKGKEFSAEDRKRFNNMEPKFMEEYSSSGIILKSVSYDSNGKIISHCLAESTGNRINRVNYFTADTATGYGKTIYKEDFLTEVKYYNSKNDTLAMSVKYDYDQNGNRIKLQIFDYKGVPGAYTLYKYNDKGHLVRCNQFDKSGKSVSQIDIIRGDKGDRLSTNIEIFGANSRIVKYAFKSEFDKNGNWVKALMYVDNEPLIIRERQIEYYE